MPRKKSPHWNKGDFVNRSALLNAREPELGEAEAAEEEGTEEEEEYASQAGLEDEKMLLNAAKGPRRCASK